MAAFGDEKGWDVPLGLKMEIIPLTRPFANYSGNIFQGRVLLDGKPVPGAEVEVEYYNRDDVYTTPNVYFMTQVIKTDENGVFTYCAPWPGWWGFAALKTDRKKMEHQGALKDVELGGGDLDGIHRTTEEIDEDLPQFGSGSARLGTIFLRPAILHRRRSLLGRRYRMISGRRLRD